MASGTMPAAAHAELPGEVVVALEEYRTVREEELGAVQAHVTTLRYGITGCALAVGVAIQQHQDRYLGWMIALALVPLLVLFSAVIWMGEYERMARASHYVAMLEARINERFVGIHPPPLRWGSWLQEGWIGRSRITGGLHRYVMIIVIFLGLEVVATVFGLHFYWHRHFSDPARRWVIPAAVLFDTSMLVVLLIYFRSSYERLRAFADRTDEGQPAIRRRLRMRLRLYGLFLLVGFLSVPLFAWPLGVLGTRVAHAPTYAAAVPVLLWMLLLPLIAHRDLMRELLVGRIAAAESLTAGQQSLIDDEQNASQLTAWEQDRVRVVKINGLNAPAIGRHGVTVTTMALSDPDTLPGALAHEVAHHRLRHLRAHRLSYLYLWPYLYYDDRVRRFATRNRTSSLSRAFARVVRIGWTLVALPGWVAWVVLRWGWRTAEYDADRFARSRDAHRAALEEALDREALRHQQWRLRPRDERLRDIWRALKDRVAEQRALGYLPVPNEHPSPRRRLRRLRI